MAGVARHIQLTVRAGESAVTSWKMEFKPENLHLLFMLHPKWSRKLLNTLAERIDQRLAAFASTPLSALRENE
ncbi:MAG: hypothetical protein H7A21_07980 [Spirochaetales bacterium]|nr:hypothetical protein [Leptospiraceae bacterium]MCP5481354.1 hypothetical protein [Spirochaetales bacterium]